MEAVNRAIGNTMRVSGVTHVGFQKSGKHSQVISGAVIKYTSTTWSKMLRKTIASEASGWVSSVMHESET